MEQKKNSNPISFEVLLARSIEFLAGGQKVWTTSFSLRINYCFLKQTLLLKGALSSLRQFFATESPLKMMKNDF